MVRISIEVGDIVQVLAQYDQIKVYKSATETGTYTEITGVGTRITMYPEYPGYYYDDMTGSTNDYYKTSYYNSTSTLESALSSAMRGGISDQKVGYSFGNYTPPPGEWGEVLTPDDIRYTYLWGIDCTASDIAESNFEDEQLRFYIREALGEFERMLTIDIRKRVYKCNPEATLKRSKYWRTGVDYTDEDDMYPYDPIMWQNFGFIQLRHVPVLSVDRAIMRNPVYGQMMNLIDNNWLRVSKKTGQLHMYPKGGSPYGPFASGVLPWRIFGGRYADAFEFDYTTGFLTAEFVPDDLRGVIGKWTTIKSMASIGDGLLAGFSSQSVSLDGLSESFSSTQSATSAYFGARIIQYQKEIKEWLDGNRMKYGVIPMSFVGY
jgi:hypothetical protein